LITYCGEIGKFFPARSLDAGQFPDDGRQFLDRCQKTLLDLRDSLHSGSRPPDSFMLGYLYDVMNRCQHELVRASA
jgi:hypothetical protein